jgi:hypothetical protein
MCDRILFICKRMATKKNKIEEESRWVTHGRVQFDALSNRVRVKRKVRWSNPISMSIRLIQALLANEDYPNQSPHIRAHIANHFAQQDPFTNERKLTKFNERTIQSAIWRAKKFLGLK